VSTLSPKLTGLTSLLLALRDCLRARAVLQLELLALRHQIHVLTRSRPRPRLTRTDWAGGRIHRVSVGGSLLGELPLGANEQSVHLEGGDNVSFFGHTRATAWLLADVPVGLCYPAGGQLPRHVADVREWPGDRWTRPVRHQPQSRDSLRRRCWPGGHIPPGRFSSASLPPRHESTRSRLGLRNCRHQLAKIPRRLVPRDHLAHTTTNDCYRQNSWPESSLKKRLLSTNLRI
jgi:hypothetical protein